MSMTVMDDDMLVFTDIEDPESAVQLTKDEIEADMQAR